MYGEGISRTSELVDLGVKYGLVNKSGAWFSMGDTRLGQGRDAAKQYFKEHPDIADAVQREIMIKVEEERSKIPQARLSSCPRASRPHRQRSLPHPSRRLPRRFRSTRTILTTSTTKNERG